MLAPKLRAGTPLGVMLVPLDAISSVEDGGPFSLQLAVRERLPPPGGIATTAAILFPVFAQARARARDIASLSNLKQIGLAALMYMQDYNERLPPLKDIPTARRALKPYLRAEDLFEYPGTGAAYAANSRLSRRPLASIAAPARTVLFYETSPSASGTRGVVYLDGHARRVPEAEWPREKAKSGIP
jgi:hypothetical protein